MSIHSIRSERQQPPTPAEQVAARPTDHRWRWVLLVGVLVLVMLVGWLGQSWLWPHRYSGIVIDATEPAADFALTSSSGQPMHLRDLRGRYVLLFFGYTTCPDRCPLTLANLAQMRTLLGDQSDQVQVVLVTVDPARDTPARLASYLGVFDHTFLGLTGAPDVIRAVATQFGVYFEQQPTANAAVDHTGTVTVIDPAGYVRLLFPPATTSADMAADLAYLLQQPTIFTR